MQVQRQRSTIFKSNYRQPYQIKPKNSLRGLLNNMPTKNSKQFSTAPTRTMNSSHNTSTISIGRIGSVTPSRSHAGYPLIISQYDQKSNSRFNTSISQQSNYDLNTFISPVKKNRDLGISQSSNNQKRKRSLFSLYDSNYKEQKNQRFFSPRAERGIQDPLIMSERNTATWQRASTNPTTPSIRGYQGILSSRKAIKGMLLKNEKPVMARKNQPQLTRGYNFLKRMNSPKLNTSKQPLKIEPSKRLNRVKKTPPFNYYQNLEGRPLEMKQSRVVSDPKFVPRKGATLVNIKGDTSTILPK